MRAVTIPRFGGPEVLEVIDVPVRVPGPGEIRIRVHAAAVNPTDLVFRSGGHAGRIGSIPPPWIPGMDCAGIVDATGEGSRWTEGTAVMAVVAPVRAEGGAQATHVVVPDTWATDVPDGLTLVAAATVPMNGLTARRALDCLGLAPGDTLAVTGAAGVLGGVLVQLATHEGITVVADAAPADADLVRRLGAAVVVSRGAGMTSEIRTAVPGGVDALVDAALIGRPAIAAVRDGGDVAVVRRYDDEISRDIRVHRVLVSVYIGNEPALRTLATHVSEGILTPRVASTHDAADVALVHRRMERGGVRGRMVLTF